MYIFNFNYFYFFGKIEQINQGNLYLVIFQVQLILYTFFINAIQFLHK